MKPLNVETRARDDTDVRGRFGAGACGFAGRASGGRSRHGRGDLGNLRLSRRNRGVGRCSWLRPCDLPAPQCRREPITVDSTIVRVVSLCPRIAASFMRRRHVVDGPGSGGSEEVTISTSGSQLFQS